MSSNLFCLQFCTLAFVLIFFSNVNKSFQDQESIMGKTNHSWIHYINRMVFSVLNVTNSGQEEKPWGRNIWKEMKFYQAKFHVYFQESKKVEQLQIPFSWTNLAWKRPTATVHFLVQPLGYTKDTKLNICHFSLFKHFHLNITFIHIHVPGGRYSGPTKLSSRECMVSLALQDSDTELHFCGRYPTFSHFTSNNFLNIFMISKGTELYGDIFFVASVIQKGVIHVLTSKYIKPTSIQDYLTPFDELPILFPKTIKVLQRHHVAFSKYSRIIVTFLFEGKERPAISIEDGPQGIFSSSRFSTLFNGTVYTTTSFQCQIFVVNLWPNPYRGYQVKENTDLFAPKVMNLSRKEMLQFSNRHIGYDFRHIVVQVPANTFINGSIKELLYVGHVSNISVCRDAGVAVYDWVDGVYPDWEEISTMCISQDHLSKLRNIHSKSRYVLFVFYAYSRFTKRFKASIEIQPTKCRSVYINTCEPFIKGEEEKPFQIFINDRNCHIVQLDYKVLNYGKERNAGYCSFRVGAAPVDSDQWMIHYSITGHLRAQNQRKFLSHMVLISQNSFAEIDTSLSLEHFFSLPLPKASELVKRMFLVSNLASGDFVGGLRTTHQMRKKMTEKIQNDLVPKAINCSIIGIFW